MRITISHPLGPVVNSSTTEIQPARAIACVIWEISIQDEANYFKPITSSTLPLLSYKRHAYSLHTCTK